MKFLIIVLLLVNIPRVQAVDPKLKVLGTMCIYGTVGGFLLGTASIAFGGEERNVFKGASLGLYAGILFGGYVIIGYYAQKNGWGGSSTSDGYYPETSSPYETQRWNANFQKPDMGFKKRAPLFYMNVFKYKF